MVYQHASSWIHSVERVTDCSITSKVREVMKISQLFALLQSRDIIVSYVERTRVLANIAVLKVQLTVMKVMR